MHCNLPSIFTEDRELFLVYRTKIFTEDSNLCAVIFREFSQKITPCKVQEQLDGTVEGRVKKVSNYQSTDWASMHEQSRVQ